MYSFAKMGKRFSHPCRHSVLLCDFVAHTMRSGELAKVSDIGIANMVKSTTLRTWPKENFITSVVMNQSLSKL